jgi:hypothetical protein
MQTNPVHDALRVRMRQIREDHARTLGDVARAARELGHTWDAAFVLRTERGERLLTLPEFLDLDTIMSVACDDVVLFSDLLPCEADDRETLTLIEDVVVKLATPYLAADDPEDRMGARAASAKLLGIRLEILAEHRETPTDEVRRLAGEFRTSMRRVIEAIASLVESGRWKSRDVRSERERRLAGKDLSDPTRAKSLRVRTTVQLKREIREQLEGEHGDDHETGEREIPRPVEDAGRR